MVRRAGVLTKKGRSYMASIIKRKKHIPLFITILMKAEKQSRNGKPGIHTSIIEKEFSLLKQRAGLPNVVFHSLRLQ